MTSPRPEACSDLTNRDRNPASASDSASNPIDQTSARHALIATVARQPRSRSDYVRPLSRGPTDWTSLMPAEHNRPIYVVIVSGRALGLAAG